MSEDKIDIYLALAGMNICSVDESLQYVTREESLIARLPEEEQSEANIKVYNSFGNSYYNQKKYTLAIENYEKVIENWLKNKSETQTYKVARCYDHCGYSYTAKKL